jgi:hypothetical protein
VGPAEWLGVPPEGALDGIVAILGHVERADDLGGFVLVVSALQQRLDHLLHSFDVHDAGAHCEAAVYVRAH